MKVFHRRVFFVSALILTGFLSLNVEAANLASKWFGSYLIQPNTAGTVFVTPTMAGGTNASEANAYGIMPTSGTIQKLRVKVDAAPGTGKSWTITLRKELANTTLTCVVSDTNTSCSDTSHSVTTSAGDRVSLSIVAASAPAAARLSFILEFVPDNQGETVFLGNSGGGLSNTSPISYFALGGFGGINANEATRNMVLPTGGTIKNFYLRLSTAPGGSATRTFSLRQNSATTSMSLTFNPSDSGVLSTTTSVSVSAGDLVDFVSATSSTPTSSTIAWGVVFVPTNNGDFVIPAIHSSSLSSSVTNYLGLSALYTSNATTSESGIPNLGSSDYVIKAAYVKLSVAPGASKSYTSVLRENSGTAATPFSVAITGTSNTTGNATGTFTPTDDALYDTQFTPASSPTSAMVAISYLGNSPDITPPIISAIATSTTATTATITWTTDENSTSTVSYGSNSSYGSASTSASLVTSHSISLTGLTQNTTYHFNVGSQDASGNVATSSDQTFTTAIGITTPTVLTPTTTALGQTTATASSTLTATGGANATSTGFVYGTTSAYGATTTPNTGNFGAGTAFTGSISGLSCNVTYHFAAFATNSAGISYSTDGSFTTAGCAPTLTTPNTTATTQTSVTASSTITAVNGANATSTAFVYGSTSAYGATTTPNTGDFGANTAFSGSISGLSCNVTYHFASYATYASGIVYSSDNTFITAPCVPTVLTPTTTALGQTTATASSTLTATGGANATSTGFVYGTTSAYGATTTPNTGNFGAGTAFTGSISGLSCNVTYHFAAFATNSAGISYSTDSSFLTSPCVETVVTDAASSITRTTATLNATITSTGGAETTQDGFAYGTVSDLSTVISTSTVATSSTSFNQPISSLTCNTTYYFRPYADNSAGRAFGSITSFTTSACVTPTVTAQAASSISNSAAILNGTITDSGGINNTVEGFNYGLDSSYGSTTSSSGSFSAGSFNLAVTNLTCNTTYHYQAFATNSAGTGTSTDASFVTASCSTSAPTVSTDAISSITATTATFNGSIIATGGANATSSGFAYGTASDLSTTIATSSLGAQTGTASFNDPSISGLSCNTTYYVRAYATNSAGIGVGSIVSFLTSPCVPTVTVQAATSIDLNSVSLNETLVSLGGAATISRGFEYGVTTSYGSTLTRPGSFTTGSYANSVTGLACGTTYHFRGFAINSSGTGSSTDSTFSTLSCQAPTVLTLSASAISATGATLNGSISVQGGEDAGDSGFAYGTASDLSTTIATSSLGAQTGTASFSSTLSSLVSSTTYYYRAYATNSGGTGFGSITSFTTSSTSPTTTTTSSSSAIPPTAVAAFFSSNSSARREASRIAQSRLSVQANAASDRSISQSAALSFVQALVKAGILTQSEAGASLETISNNQPSQNSAVVPTQNLSKGLQGPSVKSLQVILRDKGYLSATPNGIFGPQTKAALQAYQKANGIPATGFFGPLTRAALKAK